MPKVYGEGGNYAWPLQFQGPWEVIHDVIDEEDSDDGTTEGKEQEDQTQEEEVSYRTQFIEGIGECQIIRVTANIQDNVGFMVVDFALSKSYMDDETLTSGFLMWKVRCDCVFLCAMVCFIQALYIILMVVLLRVL